MIIRAYAIFDRKSLAYFPPFYAPTDGAAVRSLGDLVSDVNNNVGRHPNDFVLFYVGDYDDSKGALLPVSPVVHVIDAINLVQAMQSEIPFPDGLTSPRNQDAPGSARPGSVGRPSNGEVR